MGRPKGSKDKNSRKVRHQYSAKKLKLFKRFFHEYSSKRNNKGGLSTCKIAKEYSTDPSNINRILKQNDIKIRTKKEAKQLYLQTK